MRGLGVEGEVLQLLLRSAFHGDKLALLRTAGQARHDVGYVLLGHETEVVIDKLVLYLLFKMTKYTFFVTTDIIQIVTCK